MSNLPDNYFRRFTPAELIAAIAASQPTLAQLSLENAGELERIGWANNPIVDILYSLTSAGVWVANTDANGRVVDGASTATSNWHHRSASANVMPTFVPQTTTDGIGGAVKRYAVVPITTNGAGAAADTVCLVAVSGYKGCFRVLGIISSITEGTTVIDFEDEDNTDLEGNLSGGFALNLTAATVNTQLNGVVFRGTAVSKSLECDVTGHAAGGTILLYLETWYEKDT